jgi:hypothetical protein
MDMTRLVSIDLIAVAVTFSRLLLPSSSIGCGLCAALRHAVQPYCARVPNSYASCGFCVRCILTITCYGLLHVFQDRRMFRGSVLAMC